MNIELEMLDPHADSTPKQPLPPSQWFIRLDPMSMCLHTLHLSFSLFLPDYSFNSLIMHMQINICACSTIFFNNISQIFLNVHVSVCSVNVRSIHTDIGREIVRCSSGWVTSVCVSVTLAVLLPRDQKWRLFRFPSAVARVSIFSVNTPLLYSVYWGYTPHVLSADCICIQQGLLSVIKQ